MRDLAVDLIADTDRNLIQIPQHVEAGHCHLGGALRHAAVAGSNAVEPAHAAWSAGSGAEFAPVAAASAKLFGFVAEDFADEFARADRAGIRLGDGNHFADGSGGNTRADRAVPRKGGGRGDHRIDAEVGILQGTKLTLQQNVLVLADRLLQEFKRIGHIGGDDLLAAHEIVKDFLLRDLRLAVELPDEHILDAHHPADLRPEIFLVGKKLVDLEADLGVFIRIEGGNSRLGGAERLAAETLLLVYIKQHMIGHDKLRTLGYQDFGRGHALLDDLGKLLFKFKQIECDTVADNVDGMLMAHARRQQMKCKPAVIVYDSMSCVGAALKANHNVRLGRKHIRNLALALIAPVSSDNSLNQSRSSPI